MSVHNFSQQEIADSRNPKLNKVLAELVTNKELNAEVEAAFAQLEKQRADLANKALAKFDLSVDEKQAIVSKDFNQLVSLGASVNILKRADWCTGD